MYIYPQCHSCSVSHSRVAPLFFHLHLHVRSSKGCGASSSSQPIAKWSPVERSPLRPSSWRHPPCRSSCGSTRDVTWYIHFCLKNLVFKLLQHSSTFFLGYLVIFGLRMTPRWGRTKIHRHSGWTSPGGSPELWGWTLRGFSSPCCCWCQEDVH